MKDKQQSSARVMPALSGAALLMLVVALALRSSPESAPPRALEGHGPQSTEPADGLAGSARPEVSWRSAAGETSVLSEAEEPIARAARSKLMIGGRCLDSGGNPIAGVRVRVERADTESPSGSPDTGAEALTDASGSFALLGLPGLSVLELSFEAEGFASMRARLAIVHADDETLDVGDFTLPSGVHLHGVLVDQLERTLESQPIALEALGRPRREPWVERPQPALTSADGAFDFGWCLPGRYLVRVPGKVLRSPQVLRFELDEVPRSLRIVVAEDSRLQFIEGLVADSRGLPLAGSLVQAAEQGRKRRVAVTDERGWFSIPREGGESRPAVLSATAEGHDITTLAEAVAWGERSVQITLRELATLELRVTEAPTGSPVTRFGLRLHRRDGHPLAPIEFGALVPRTHVGEHAGGRLRVTGLLRGRYECRVEPAEGLPLSASPYFELHIEGATTQPVEVRLARRVERTLRVAMPDGVGIAGCRVRTCLDREPPVGSRTSLVSAQDWGRLQAADRALLLQEGTTDGDGRLVLHGPSGAAVSIRIEGPGCLPELLDPVSLDAGDLIEYTARVPAVVSVHVLQPAILGELATVLRRPPRLRFQVPGASGNRRDEGHATVLSETDSPTLLELPAGTWQPILDLERAEFPLELLTVRAGGSSELRLDLSEHRPIELRGRVLESGHELALTRIRLERWTFEPARDASRWVRKELSTDPAGRFEFRGLPGRYRLLLPARVRGSSGIRAHPPELSIEPGGHLARDFSIRTGSLQLRVLDARGAPVEGLRGLELRRSLEGDPIAELGPTDREGRVELEECEAGFLFLRVLPARLASRSARIALLRKAGDPDALDREWISLPGIDIAEGAPSPREIVLPDGYFQ